MGITNYRVCKKTTVLNREKENENLYTKDEFKNIINNVKKEDSEIQKLSFKEKSGIFNMDFYVSKQNSNKLNVACILDEFSYNCFKNECNLIELNPDNWTSVLNQEIDFLFVESAWNGNNGAWGNMPLLLNDRLGQNRFINLIDDIMNCCKKKGIPTVFWNKEDPVHYEKFILLAKKFQYIFTTDRNMISGYIEDVGHSRVYELPFAANIKIHNPINKDAEKIGDLAFAGSWYEHHEDRKLDMEKVLLPALDFGVHIYDRNYGITTNDSLVFPEIYQRNIVGRLSYSKMVDYYKKYKIFLNTNTVQDSPTMFSRRVFELLACGTNIISGYSLGIEKMLREVVLIGKDSEEIRAHIKRLVDNKRFSEILSILGTRKVIEGHTYTHRFNDIANKIKIYNYRDTEKGASLVTILTDIRFMDNIISNYTSQKYFNKELIILIKNDSIDRLKVAGYVEGIEDVYIYQIDSKSALGEYLNYGVLRANKDYISIFSESDYYGEHYLIDMLNSFKYSGVKVAGKSTIFRYLEDESQLVISNANNENRYCGDVFKSTIIIDKSVLVDNLFSSKCQNPYTEFLKDCTQKNIEIYSVDKYNYICFDKGYKKYSTEEAVLEKVTTDAINYVSI